MIGQTLSHYRVTAALGAGGMGEVYRATDTSLQREAHLLAALNHPNIAAIYGLEEADGKPFLALELVEGEDIKQRLARGAVPVDEAFEIARQIAEALEEAHNKGIVHRDLKPANVKLPERLGALAEERQARAGLRRALPRGRATAFTRRTLAGLRLPGVRARRGVPRAFPAGR